jgi:hypothetical protein
MLDQNQKSFLKKIVPSLAFVAGLCCFTPIVLVLFCLSSVAFASSLADTLYGQYKWVFRGASLALFFCALWWYFYKTEKVCTWEEAKRKRNRIINMAAIALIIGSALYIIWLYVILHYAGVYLDIWQ